MSEPPQRILDTILIVGAPLLLAVVELVHPHPHDLMHIDVQRWLAVHYAQIPLFPLAALGVATLVRGKAGIAVCICRVAMFVFGVGWAAWDSVAGVATGILIKAAQNSADPAALQRAVDLIWTHPIVGGAPAPLFAVMGSIALSIGCVATAVVLKRSGSSWGPVVLLAVSSFGLSIFRTHAWPGGPLTFGGIAIASAWVLWERTRKPALRS
jgi:hypothetical protein